MAKSPTHKFGQIIGDLLERSMEKPLQNFVNKHQRLYLDKKGIRNARGNKRKVTWIDNYGNTHDLDFVIEWDGTEHQIGKPAAFIESAWRRYTKHSRNKAQEIQGAISPLIEKYLNDCPFTGVILGGVFTQGSLDQLSSLGFKILYYNYETIIEAFSVVGIDAFFDEDTPDDTVKGKVDAYNALSPGQIIQIEDQLRELRENDLDNFISELEETILRKIQEIIVVALHGTEYKVTNIDDAIEYINSYRIEEGSLDIKKFEIFIRYSNGDKVDASFKDRHLALKFLINYE